MRRCPLLALGLGLLSLPGGCGFLDPWAGSNDLPTLEGSRHTPLMVGDERVASIVYRERWPEGFVPRVQVRTRQREAESVELDFYRDAKMEHPPFLKTGLRSQEHSRSILAAISPFWHETTDPWIEAAGGYAQAYFRYRIGQESGELQPEYAEGVVGYVRVPLVRVASIDDALPVASEPVNASLTASLGRSVFFGGGQQFINIPSSHPRWLAVGMRLQWLLDGVVVGTARAHLCERTSLVIAPVEKDFPGMQPGEVLEGRWSVRISDDPEWHFVSCTRRTVGTAP